MISIPGGGKCDELPVTPCVHRDLTSPFLVIEFMHVSIIVQLTLYKDIDTVKTSTLDILAINSTVRSDPQLSSPERIHS